MPSLMVSLLSSGSVNPISSAAAEKQRGMPLSSIMANRVGNFWHGVPGSTSDSSYIPFSLHFKNYRREINPRFFYGFSSCSFWTGEEDKNFLPSSPIRNFLKSFGH
jgi:hypothetical protein